MDLIKKVREYTGLSYRSLAQCITRDYDCPISAQALQQAENVQRRSIRLPLLLAINKMMSERYPELGVDWALQQVDPALRSR